MSENFTPQKEKIVGNLPSPRIIISPVKVPNGAKQIGNYILGKTIGSGTFGKVHLGLHILTGQKVAVKIIDKLKLNNKDLQRVHRQIDILKKVMHPSLIQLYQIIETQKSLLFVTQYIPNGQLFNYIIQHKKLDQQEACRIFHQIIQGVEYMHNAGIVHRDLKPQNILMDFDGKIKIIDFGLSNTYLKGQKLKTQCGSPCYAAPQMIQGKKYEPVLIDTWSTGVVLFAMLSGFLPFCDADTSKLYKKILAGAFTFPPWISNDAKDLLQKMLVVNPLKRAKISQIMEHPWYKKINTKKSIGINTKYYRIPHEISIIKKIQLIGLNDIKLIQSIQLNLKTKQTALYYIIAKKMVRQGHQIQSFFGCPFFQQQLLKPIESPIDQADSSTYIDVQIVQPVPVMYNQNTPQTTSSTFEHVLQQFMNMNSQKQDPKTLNRKNQFYANNLQNKRKKQNLKLNSKNKGFYLYQVNVQVQRKERNDRFNCNPSTYKNRSSYQTCELIYRPKVATIASLNKRYNNTAKSLKKPIKLPDIKNIKRQIETGDTTTSKNSRKNRIKNNLTRIYLQTENLKKNNKTFV